MTNDTSRILVADDEKGFSTTTALILQKEGFACEVAPDGDSALSLLAAKDFHLLIADIRMPGNADLQLVRKVSEVTRGLPVIIVTGHPSVETATESVSLPVFAYMVKPLDWDALMERVHAAVKWNQAYRVVAAAENRLAESVKDTAMINAIMAASAERGWETSLRSFLASTLGAISGAASDLHKLFVALQFDENPESVCQVLDCPRVKTIETIVMKVIETLKATKGSFKSRELAELRRDLEEFLDSERRKWSREKT
jgi:DNA-binding response OmpR family regulator